MEQNHMKILDLYSCAGGAAMGYHRAGFDVFGVDIEPQPNYPFPHATADAVEFLLECGHEFDWIHASPPCQAHSATAKGTNKKLGVDYIDDIPRLRPALLEVGVPYILENVAGAPIRKDLMLCGEMFGLPLLLHRYFEIHGAVVEQPVHPKHRGRVRGWRHGVYYDGPYIAAYGKGGGKASVQEIQEAKQMPWTNVHKELTEALPVPYTEYIGNQILNGGLR